ncbi:MAG: hypothetical protein V1810_00705 [Candidatus Beckwithbacteria bacterium]
MSFWELFYPAKCLGCSRGGKYLCDECLKTVKINYLTSQDGSSLFEYRGVMRTAIQQLKYGFLKDITGELSELITRGLKQKLQDRSEWRLKKFIKLKPKVQAMPLFRWRQNWRGFNQAEILAKIAAEELGLTLIDCLVRVKKTRAQMSLKREQRLKNVAGVFKVKPGWLPKSVLVVDDVWTSGATIREAMKTLQEKNCKVYGLTLAR